MEVVKDRIRRFLREVIEDYIGTVVRRIIFKLVLALSGVIFLLIGLIHLFSGISLLLATHIPQWAAQMISGILALLIGLLLVVVATLRR